MNNIIVTRQYTARQATLMQQRPGDIISAAQKPVETLAGSQLGRLQVVYPDDQTQALASSVLGLDSFGKGLGKALTAGTVAYVLCVSSPTNSPELFTAPDDIPRENAWIRWSEQAKEALQKGALKEQHPSTAVARLRVNRLATLQAAFGLTTQDLASVLGISRQQLYKWLDAANPIQIQEASRVRLSILERIAKEWMSRSKVPLSSVSREAVTDGKTVLAMMSADIIDETLIVDSFDELVTKLQTKPKTRSQRLREAGFTRRTSSLPLDD
ncbi:helix-turn-helix transcriptional regulator [Methylicorpusculum sp.]|uniref:helix-turn-helix transcriptional regulator n=1 Tax=Methylicorpusculum sp. TaxID=2713644 RepID=UPI00271CD2A0|nr:helix-turn-helix transcriptional regulator [Methylicorpusculum sp.]MDO8843061.1 helix-turn-helix transcriptional regulator [Methylicorpusculum sp.]